MYRCTYLSPKVVGRADASPTANNTRFLTISIPIYPPSIYLFTYIIHIETYLSPKVGGNASASPTANISRLY